MHYLCHALNLIGEEAYVTTRAVDPGLRTPILTEAIKLAHLAAGRSPIAIYPEIISGNPFQTRNVVRYLLAKPALHTGQPIDLQARDLVYTFGPTLVPDGWTADPLRMPLVDTRIFNSDGVDDRRRHGSAVFINRHLRRGGSLHPATADSIEISYRVPERSAQEMADIFREVECLYLYEPSTAGFEALLCGCPVVYIMNDISLPHADLWLMDGKGISWGLEPADIARAKATVHEVQDFYQKEEATFWKQLYAFVEKTQAHAVGLDGSRVTTNNRAGQSTPRRKKRLAVLSAEPANGPSSFVRLAKPFALLDQEWDVDWPIKNNNIDTNALSSADLIVMQRFAPGLLPIASLEQLFALGKPVVYETDDLLNDMPNHHPLAASGKQWKEGIEYAARHAQAIVVPTDDLANEFRHLNNRVQVLPTYVDFDLFYRPVPQSRDEVHIGVLGASSQSRNFALIDKALQEICARYPQKVKLSFIGAALPAGWENHAHVALLSAGASYEEYGAQLKHLDLDICLMPLAEDDFNRNGTSLRRLECGAAGIVGVFSDVPGCRAVVTHGSTGLVVPNSAQAWVEAIEYLIGNPLERQKIARAAQDEIRNGHDIGRNMFRYGTAYRKLLEEGRRQAPSPSSANTPAQHVMGKKRLLVCSFEPVGSASLQIRFVLPFAFLQEQWELVWGIVDGRPDPVAFNAADVVLLHRFAPAMLTQAVVQGIFQLGKPVIYETDDPLTDIRADHTLAEAGANYKSGIEYALHNADAIVVATPVLADQYRLMNPRVHVLPTYIDFDRFYRPVPLHPGDQVTIGLLGESIQQDNFALVDTALRMLCERHAGKIKVCFVGDAVPTGWESHPAAELRPLAHEYQAYAQCLLDMRCDIALVPLADNAFNGSKTAITWLEFAAAGVATILSDVSTYRSAVTHGRDGVLVPDAPDAWLHALTSLVENAALRRQIARTAQAEVRRHHSLREKSQLYHRTYLECARKGGRVAAATPPSGAVVPAVLILDADGNMEKIQLSLSAQAKGRHENLMTVVLTTLETDLPDWTSRLRYLKATAQEYPIALEQLCALRTFDWAMITEAGTEQYA